MSATFDDTKWHSYTSSTQTMRTWAEEITRYEDVPAAFRSAFTEPAEPFPYTIYLPEETKGKTQSKSQLIRLDAEQFTLHTIQQNALQTITSRFDEVIYLERGKVLLNSWLVIKTAVETAVLQFNTTNNHLFRPIIDKIRQGMVPFTTNISEPDLSAFDYLDKINYKYMNYGRSSVRDGDAVVAVVYQPEQDMKAIGLLGKTLYRRYKTSHLTVLTEQELILIRENQPIRNNFDPTDGGVFIYIPRRKIEMASFIANEAESMMRVCLPAQARVTVAYTVEIDGLKAKLGMV